MQVWHLEVDTPLRPARPSPGEPVVVSLGTWPVAPDQSVWVSFEVVSAIGHHRKATARGRWLRNEGENSYWEVDLGRFERGDRVAYHVVAEAADGEVVSTPEYRFKVGPRLHVALLFHQHQPVYRAFERQTPRGSYRQPWVRLHTLRDYAGLPLVLARHPDVRLTVNLSPALLWQLDDYCHSGATDRAFELSRKPAERLREEERAEICATFFDAHGHHQIYVHPRYRELFDARTEGRSLSLEELRDLQMWFNLAWFGVEAREGSVALPNGDSVSVRRFVAQGRGFSHHDIECVLAEQLKLLAALVPLHRALRDKGQVELSTSPFFHPVLPLLVDSDRATVDRPGASLPRRFSHPEDAVAQVRMAVVDYTRRFGEPPRGMFPPEAAVSQAVVPCFASQGIRWLVSDARVLERSGKFGYRIDDPNVTCRPYRAEEGSEALSIFFRDPALSDAICQGHDPGGDSEGLANRIVQEIKERFSRRSYETDPILTLAFDGGKPWGGYPRDGRPFLNALFSAIALDPELDTTTFSDYLDGSPARDVAPHPIGEQTKVHDLFAGSWSDEPGSNEGVDLGNWIGEDEENRAWELLGHARDALERAGQTAVTHPEAFHALYAAEGSDWFWWYGSDQDSGQDDEFDALFREHLRAAYRSAGLEPPRELYRAIVPGVVRWSFTSKVNHLDVGARLLVCTNCPGVIEWYVDAGPTVSVPVSTQGGPLAGVRFRATLGPFEEDTRRLVFRFRCANAACDREHPACAGEEQSVFVGRGGERSRPAEAHP